MSVPTANFVRVPGRFHSGRGVALQRAKGLRITEGGVAEALQYFDIVISIMRFVTIGD